MTRTPVSLLERLRTRSDQEAWQRFVQLYGPLLYRWLHQDFHLQHQDACDVSQDVLLAVVGAMPTFHYDPQKHSFRGWLRQVMINRLRGFWRRKGNLMATTDDALEHRLAELEDPGSAAAGLWEQEHDGRVTRRVLALLQAEFEPTTWQAFWAVVVEGSKPAEVARRLGLTRNAVHIAKCRVRRRLQQETRGLFD